jgi:LacI family transcriptional regulator
VFSSVTDKGLVVLTSITITDVAALAGVSIKTVSRVLNSEPNVRDGTRERVLSAVNKLNYKPNLAARALAGSRSYLIGLYYDNPSPGYIADLQRGAMSACRKAGYHLLVEQIDGEKERWRPRVESLLDQVKVDGVILAQPVCDRGAVLDVLEERNAPFVRIAPAGDWDRGPYVYMNDRQAAYDMTDHLLSLGHRRIGFIRGHPEHSATQQRYLGFAQAMAAADQSPDPALVQWGSFTFRSGVGAAERLLNRPVKPTAIFASNDDMALGVMAVANRMQLNVPRDLSVAGFDDSPIAQVVWPQLTSIRIPVAEMAEAAANILIHKRLQQQAPAARLLDFELMLRGSVGPASLA